MKLHAPLIVLALGLAACRLPYAGGARPADVSALDENWHRAAPTPVVKQRDRTDCGLAALAMIGGAWGQSWTLTELAQEVPPTKHGVRLGALRDHARSHGLVAYAVRGTHDDLMFELARHRPVVLGLVLPFARDRALAHYEVVIAIDKRDGTVVTLDPATGKHMRRTRDVLEKEWKAAGYATLVVVGAAGDGLASE
jgi:ABC-type bacteriocin/lantibiotic exporter with double-glycine peptidase domain